MGQVPVLKVDGVQYCQTDAIVGYAAKLSGLPKLSDIEELTSTMVMETTREIYEQLYWPAGMAMRAIPESGL